LIVEKSVTLLTSSSGTEYAFWEGGVMIEMFFVHEIPTVNPNMRRSVEKEDEHRPVASISASTSSRIFISLEALPLVVK
jgi:hypothetical protein